MMMHTHEAYSSVQAHTHTHTPQCMPPPPHPTQSMRDIRRLQGKLFKPAAPGEGGGEGPACGSAVTSPAKLAGGSVPVSPIKPGWFSVPASPIKRGGGSVPASPAKPGGPAPRGGAEGDVLRSEVRRLQAQLQERNDALEAQARSAQVHVARIRELEQLLGSPLRLRQLQSPSVGGGNGSVDGTTHAGGGCEVLEAGPAAAQLMNLQVNGLMGCLRFLSPTRVAPRHTFALAGCCSSHTPHTLPPTLPLQATPATQAEAAQLARMWRRLKSMKTLFSTFRATTPSPSASLRGSTANLPLSAGVLEAGPSGEDAAGVVQEAAGSEGGDGPPVSVDAAAALGNGGSPQAVAAAGGSAAASSTASIAKQHGSSGGAAGTCEAPGQPAPQQGEAEAAGDDAAALPATPASACSSSSGSRAGAGAGSSRAASGSNSSSASQRGSGGSVAAGRRRSCHEQPPHTPGGATRSHAPAHPPAWGMDSLQEENQMLMQQLQVGALLAGCGEGAADVASVHTPSLLAPPHRMLDPPCRMHRCLTTLSHEHASLCLPMPPSPDGTAPQALLSEKGRLREELAQRESYIASSEQLLQELQVRGGSLG